MKPFTDYSCTGDIKMNNVSINKTLPPVQFNIDCDFTVEKLEISTTNTSIKLNWETKSDNCQDVLKKLDELSYHCSCQQQKGDGRYFKTDGKIINQPERRMCEFTSGIKPFRYYNCEVHHIYTGQKDFRGTKVTEKTKLGIPDQPHNVVVTVPENNKINVTCSLDYMDFNGPEKIYFAQLQGVPGSRKDNTECQFQFEDLSYSTSYTVEVFTFNGHFTSSPVRSQVDTRYNNKALIGSLVFLIYFIILCAALFILKRRISRK
ncbi:receptor-type tyrosine-protein phosphatase C-like [Gambusia affinis]|uniref:receptor-type tyrosine-protein phosphatase C-like n=1 Tax=Gambusia affinis TaxID=33528 RepID=UPI001CDD2AD8|nr:receptor-type tyrosine-protein phosphatase C-like [Gambusia affinis]